MKRKFFLVSLIVALMGALILPVLSAPAPVMASSSLSCTPGELTLTVYVGVPTTLLGFIPVETETVTVSGGSWEVSDDASWLSVWRDGLLWGSSGDKIYAWVGEDLAVGQYTATITITRIFSSDSITVPVTVNVVEPAVIGPLGIGMLNILDTSTENYGGLTVQLLTDPINMADMQAIETDGCWNLMIQRGAEIPGMGTFISSGTLSISGEDIQITRGTISSISKLMSQFGGILPIPADFDWGENYVFSMFSGEGTQYLAMRLDDLGKLLDLLPMLGSMFATEEDTDNSMNGAPPDPDANGGGDSGVPTANADLVIPLSPILDLLPTLMPVMMDLLSNETVLNVIKGLTSILPPVMIILPASELFKLAGLLM